MGKDEKDLLALVAARRKDVLELRKRRGKRWVGPLKIKDVLAQYFSHSNEARSRFDEHRALAQWEIFVGPAAAQISTALRIRNHILTVSVADPIWMQQLILLKHSLLMQYKATFPGLGLKDIYFVRANWK